MELIILENTLLIYMKNLLQQNGKKEPKYEASS